MKTKTFIDKDTIGFKMPKKRSVDIDIFEDWVHVEKIIKETDR